MEGKQTQPSLGLGQEGSWEELRKAMEPGRVISDISCLNLLSILFGAESKVSQADLQLAAEKPRMTLRYDPPAYTSQVLGLQALMPHPAY